MRFVAFILTFCISAVAFAGIESPSLETPWRSSIPLNIAFPDEGRIPSIGETLSAHSDVIPERPLPTTWCEGYQQATNEQRVEERKDRDAGLRAGMQHSGYEINQYTEVCWANFERDHAVAASTYCSNWPVDNVAFANEVEAAGTIAQACYVKQLAYSKRPSWYRFDLYVLEFLRGLFGSDDLAILG